MKISIENVYDNACKIAKNTARSYSNNSNEVLLSQEELYGDLMVKLSTPAILEKEYESEEHFYKNFKTSCVNCVKGKLSQMLFTQKSGYTEDENGGHRISVASIDAEENGEYTQNIEAISETASLSMEEQERLLFFIEELKKDDEDAVELLMHWLNPKQDLLDLISSAKNQCEASYHKCIRKYMNLSSDLYNYLKDCILALARSLFPNDCLRLGIA